MADEIKTMQEEVPESRNFIHAFIEEDIAPGGQFEGMTVHTRFPPEPNGYQRLLQQEPALRGQAGLVRQNLPVLRFSGLHRGDRGPCRVLCAPPDPGGPAPTGRG